MQGHELEMLQMLKLLCYPTATLDNSNDIMTIVVYLTSVAHSPQGECYKWSLKRVVQNN